MKIVMVASEALPFAKTGGLADVTYSLSKELALTEEVSIIIPLYKSIKDKFADKLSKVMDFTVTMCWRKSHTVVYAAKHNNITYYFIDNPQYFGRDNLYGYFDDGERFAFFNLAAAEFLAKINYVPDIIHSHDWQTGMLPCIMKENEAYRSLFAESKFFFTIHNPAFQEIAGKYPSLHQ